MGEEKEKGRYREKGYKILHWIQFVYINNLLYQTRIFDHKVFIFDHYFSNFNALFLYTCPGVSVGVSASVSVDVSDRVPPKNIIDSQSRTNKGFERVRQVYRFQFAFCSQSVSCGLIWIEKRRSFLTAFIFLFFVNI